jgi:hypothetical protein
MRLRSAVCDTEVVVVRPPSDRSVELACGGVLMLPHGSQPDESASVAAGQDGGTVLGKRYGLDDDPIEVLVTKAGRGSLSLAGRTLVTKEAKPLPSSD